MQGHQTKIISSHEMSSKIFIIVGCNLAYVISGKAALFAFRNFQVRKTSFFVLAWSRDFYSNIYPIQGPCGVVWA